VAQVTPDAVVQADFVRAAARLAFRHEGLVV